MKRFISTAAAAIVLVVGLAACGGGGGGSGSAGSFCDKVKGATLSFSNIDFTNVDEAKRAAVAIKDIANSAPSEIKADATKLADALQKFANGDISEFLNEDKQKELTTATSNVEKYIKDQCGIDINSDGALPSDTSDFADSFSSFSTTGEAVGDNQLCRDLQELGSSSDVQQTVDQLRTIDPPAELAADWDVFLDGTEAYAKGTFNDPTLAQRYGAAAAKVSTYLLENCAGVSTDSST